MFGLDQQLARLETLTCEMSRKLDAMIRLLQKLVDAQQQPGDGNSYTVKIDEVKYVPDSNYSVTVDKATWEKMQWDGQEGQDG